MLACLWLLSLFSHVGETVYQQQGLICDLEAQTIPQLHENKHLRQQVNRSGKQHVIFEFYLSIKKMKSGCRKINRTVARIKQGTLYPGHKYDMFSSMFRIQRCFSESLVSTDTSVGPFYDKKKMVQIRRWQACLWQNSLSLGIRTKTLQSIGNADPAGGHRVSQDSISSFLSLGSLDAVIREIVTSAHYCCCRKVPQTGKLVSTKFISHSQIGWEVQDQCVGSLVSVEHLLLADGGLCLCLQHGRLNRGLFLSLFTPFMQLHPQNLLSSQRLYLLCTTFGVTISLGKF